MAASRSNSRVKVKKEENLSDTEVFSFGIEEDSSLEITPSTNQMGTGETSRSEVSSRSNAQSSLTLTARRPAWLPVMSNFSKNFIIVRLSLEMAEFDHVAAVVKKAFAANPRLWGKVDTISTSERNAILTNYLKANTEESILNKLSSQNAEAGYLLHRWSKQYANHQRWNHIPAPPERILVAVDADKEAEDDEEEVTAASIESSKSGTASHRDLFGSPFSMSSPLRGGDKEPEEPKSFTIHSHLTPGKTGKQTSLARRATANDGSLNLELDTVSGVKPRKGRGAKGPENAGATKRQQPELSTVQGDNKELDRVSKTVIMIFKIQVFLVVFFLVIIIGLVLALFFKE
ncbi:hypothetical protein TWF506_005429 [Arthrobotrys conoides]|uniref:Uncharacterized protein n=1 Tax=Arthrobotrys conoides TaxID=74498 RepID=A0AAN8NE66_9PEZI